MELDDFKASWQRQTAAENNLKKKDMEQIQAILHGKTTDLITTMKRKYEKIISMMLGSMLLLVLILPVISDGFTYPGSVNGFAKMVFFYLVLIIFYWGRLKLINNLVLSPDIKERLVQLIKNRTRNFKLEVGFIIFFFCGILIIGRFFYGKGIENIYQSDVIISFVLSIIFAGAMLFLTVKRHRRQINELKTYLAEYDEVA